MLGRVDGFENDEAESEGDERAEVLAGFLTSKRNPLEALQLANKLLDPRGPDRALSERKTAGCAPRT